MTTFNRLPSTCPTRNKKCDAATNIGSRDSHPSPGAISICFYCTSFLKFDEQMGLQLLTPDEIAYLPCELRHQLIVSRREIKAMRAHGVMREG